KWMSSKRPETKQNDKTEHGMEKRLSKIKALSPKMSKSEVNTDKDQQSTGETVGTEDYWLDAILNPSDGPGKPKIVYL
ncbi:hypothetical protein Tco_0439502, partial [Tanacetum coccineum]